VGRLEERLPLPVYVLQAGLVLNAFGNGAAIPFLVIYLHDVRGIPLAAAGAASATNAACGLVSALVSGALADRVGPRATTIGGLVLATTGFVLYPLVVEPWQAVVLAVLLGSGGGAWLTGQSALLAAITPADRRHIAFAQQRVAANVGLGLGGACGGLIVASGDAASFTRLFLLNALTFAAYALVLLAVPSARPEAGPARPLGYRALVRDRTFVRVLVIDFALIAGAVSLLNGLVPVFSRNHAGVGTAAIGLLFLANALVIVVAQLPVARALEGHRRARGLALTGLLFAVCWACVLSSAWLGVAALVVGFAVMSMAECVYDGIRGPLVADLAPGGLAGRYMAASGFAWQLGFIVGPAVGAIVLGAEALALWPVAAAVCCVASIAALRLERHLPVEVRITPARPRRP
jgi:MFS family permease